jgi:hypothetical protein
MTRMSPLRFASLVVPLVSGAACGELNDIDYRGEPIFRVEGSIDGLAPRTLGGPLYATVDWLPLSYRLPGEAAPAAAVDPVEFPAPFTAPVFTPPAEDLRLEVREGEDGPVIAELALARLIVFEDSDDDAQFSVDFDPVVGHTATRLVYARGTGPALNAALGASDLTLIANPDALVDGFQLGTLGTDGVTTIGDVEVVIDEPPPELPF